MFRSLFSPLIVLLLCTSAAQSRANVIYSGPQNIVLQGVPNAFVDVTLSLAGDPGTGDNLDLGIAGIGLGGGTNTVFPGAEVALIAISGSPLIVQRFNSGDPFPASPLFGSGGEILWGFGTGPADGDFFAGTVFGTFGTGPAYFGWIHLVVQNSATSAASIKVIDWAYSDVVGQGIAMGQVPEPSTFSLVAFLLAVVVLFGIVYQARPRLAAD